MNMNTPKCPHCSRALDEATLRAAAAYWRFRGPKAGGRPRTDALRCACGAMTLKCAKARAHKCTGSTE